jgi:DNA invertase Pin-like site-specific DNA recombinase
MASATSGKAVTALYCRISLDDDNRDESNSITNQRDLLNACVVADSALSASKGLIFTDDGHSGTNFERPQVKALLDLVRRGEVQNIVVKDLSRWGRNYPEVSEYIDQIFPFLGIRFISVNDNYDSAKYIGQTAPMDVAFSSIVHDIYSKELSVKITQSRLAKALKGEYVCGTTPYGFLRSETAKNRLVIDEKAARVVRCIFDMACQGLSSTKIAASLNSDGVDSPLEHRSSHGWSTLGIHPFAGRSFWDGSSVLRILRDERYTGTMVFSKTKQVSNEESGGGKRVINLPEEEWVKVQGAHEAIVTSEQFTKVNTNKRKYNRDKKKTSEANKINGEKQPSSPLTGKTVCGYCGRALNFRATLRPSFFCYSVKRNTGQGCYDGKIYIDDLEEVLLSAIKLEAQKALILRGSRRVHTKKTDISEKDSISIELKKLAATLDLLGQRSISLYEEYADGTIDKESYVESKNANSKDLDNVQTRIESLNQRLSEIESISSVQMKAVDEPALHSVVNATEVTGAVLSLLDRIIVFDSERIEIKFTFKDVNGSEG